jgi:hypothetical protein
MLIGRLSKERPREGKGGRPYGEWVGDLEGYPYKQVGWSLTEIAEKTGLSKVAVSKALNRLIEPERRKVGRNYESFYPTKELNTVGRWWNAGMIYLEE